MSADFKKLKEKERILKEAAEAIRVQEKDLPRVVARFKREIKEMDEQLK
jgi:hypothetical protein